MMIEELDVYRLWRWAMHPNKISFPDFKNLLIEKGYVIYSIECEGTFG